MFASPAAAQTLGQASDVEISIWRIIWAFLLCVALAVGAAFILKARKGAGAFLSLSIKRNRRLRLIENLRLGHQADLCIVECDGRELLVGISPQGVHLLAHLPEDARVKKPEGQAP